MPTSNAPVATPKKLMTADEFWDFCQLPENENRSFELIRGEVVEVSRASKPHCIVCANITRLLGNYSFECGIGYVTSNDVGTILATIPVSVVGPDVAYFTDAKTLDEVHPKWGGETPILVVEVLSPNDRTRETEGRIRDYLESGVNLVWIVEYQERTVSVHRLSLDEKVLNTADLLTAEKVLPGFSCRVAEFFRMPGDKPLTGASH